MYAPPPMALYLSSLGILSKSRASRTFFRPFRLDPLFLFFSSHRPPAGLARCLPKTPPCRREVLRWHARATPGHRPPEHTHRRVLRFHGWTRVRLDGNIHQLMMMVTTAMTERVSDLSSGLLASSTRVGGMCEVCDPVCLGPNSHLPTTSGTVLLCIDTLRSSL
jgi:hypothetical protein